MKCKVTPMGFQLLEVVCSCILITEKMINCVGHSGNSLWQRIYSRWSMQVSAPLCIELWLQCVSQKDRHGPWLILFWLIRYIYIDTILVRRWTIVCRFYALRLDLRLFRFPSVVNLSSQLSTDPVVKWIVTILILSKVHWNACGVVDITFRQCTIKLKLSHHLNVSDYIYQVCTPRNMTVSDTFIT